MTRDPDSRDTDIRDTDARDPDAQEAGDPDLVDRAPVTAASIDRRRVVRGALVAAATATAVTTTVGVRPAGAQSAMCPADVPDLSFTSSGGHGWTSFLVSGVPNFLTGAAGFAGSYRGVSPVHRVTHDALTRFVWEARTTMCLEAGYTYHFTFEIASFNNNTEWQLLDVYVDSTLLSRFTTEAGIGGADTNLPNSGSRTYTRSFTPPATGDYQFRYRHVVNPGVLGGADDIGVGFPTVTRSAV